MLLNVSKSTHHSILSKPAVDISTLMFSVSVRQHKTVVIETIVTSFWSGSNLKQG